MDLLLTGVGFLPRRWIKAVSSLRWRHPLVARAFEGVADRMRDRDGTIQQGLGKGLRFNTGNSVAGFMLGTSEPGLQDAFSLFLQPGMTVYDVGANVGFYSVISSRIVGPSGRVVAFEPLDENVRSIRHNADLNGFDRLQVQGLALGKIDGHAQFSLSSNSNWGMLASVGTPDAAAGSRTVRVARLDSLIKEGGLVPPGLMKIDVEGAEADVLEGAEQTLRTARPILFIDLHGTNGAIAESLAAQRYEFRMLGGGNVKLPDAPWWAEVIAIPSERTDLADKLEQMAHWSLSAS
jgi:FkbM family methyltransferase